MAGDERFFLEGFPSDKFLLGGLFFRISGIESSVHDTARIIRLRAQRQWRLPGPGHGPLYRALLDAGG